MKLVMDRSALLKALSHVQSVVERKGTIPVLANVRIEAEAGEARLTATDMDIAILARAPAEVLEAGATTMPAHMLYDIVRKLPDGAQLEIAASAGGKGSLRSGQSRFSLSTLPVEDFPVMAEGELPHSFTLTSAELSALIDKTRFAVSTEETRYYLNGIYLHVADGKDGRMLRAVATDGHRLARLEITLPAGAESMPGVIIPRKTIGEIKKMIEADAKDVTVSLSESKIRFACGQAVLVSKLIDGQFPDYERVIPSQNDKRMEVDGKSFLQSVDRVSVIASDKTRGIKLAFGDGKLMLSADNSEHGAVEEITVDYGAAAMEIGFNSRYLLDMLAQIEGEKVQFLLSDGISPALVRDSGDAGALYVLMPMRV